MTVEFNGRISHFGGKTDTGVSEQEGLAFIFSYDQAPWLFYSEEERDPETGLARNLASETVPYIACRWDYSVTPKEQLAQPIPALVRAVKNGKEALALPADWGPHEQETGRAADGSKYLLSQLSLVTDDEVQVIYPAPHAPAKIKEKIKARVKKRREMMKPARKKRRESRKHK
jgi:hypothetical protein